MTQARQELLNGPDNLSTDQGCSSGGRAVESHKGATRSPVVSKPGAGSTPAPLVTFLRSWRLDSHGSPLQPNQIRFLDEAADAIESLQAAVREVRDMAGFGDFDSTEALRVALLAVTDRVR